MPDPRELLIGSLNLSGSIIGRRTTGSAPKRSAWLKFWLPDRDGRVQEIEVCSWEEDRPDAFAFLSGLNVGDAVTLPIVVTPPSSGSTEFYYRFDAHTFAKWSVPVRPMSP